VGYAELLRLDPAVKGWQVPWRGAPEERPQVVE